MDFQRERSILTAHIKRDYQNRLYEESWRNLPEVPTKEEIILGTTSGSKFVEWDEYQQEPNYNPGIPHNIIDGPWPSKEDYIRAHYLINREDAIASIRESVNSVRRRPEMIDDNDTCIYTHVISKATTYCCIS